MSLDKIKEIEKTASSIIDGIFQLDRLDRLAQGSSFLRVAYAELIANVNYAVLHEPQVDDPNVSIVIANVSYPLTPAGRKGAVAESFRHFANKLDDFLSTTNALAICGYRNDVWWMRSAAFELLLFDIMQDNEFSLRGIDSISRKVKEISRSFKDLDFLLLSQKDLE